MCQETSFSDMSTSTSSQQQEHSQLRPRRASVFVIDDAKLLLLNNQNNNNIANDNTATTGNAYVVKQVLQMGTVDELLKNGTGRMQLSAQRRIQIMLEVAKVLHALHSSSSDSDAKTHHFGHISSANVGLTSNMTPKLIMSSSSSAADNAQVEHQQHKHDDIYDFGILMMELLTGSLQNNRSEDSNRKFGDYRERYSSSSGHLIEDDLDPYVRESWTFNILSQLIELALACSTISIDDSDDDDNSYDDSDKGSTATSTRPSTGKLVDTLTLISTRMQVVENYDWY